MNPLNIKKFKEHPIDPYDGKKHYLKINTQVANQSGKTYTLIEYKKSHGWGWRIKEGVIALSLTVFTGFLGLAFKRVRSHWSKANSGESIKKIKIPDPEPVSIAVPKTADFAYKGSNAEYLVLNGEGKPCTFEEYQSTALKITDQRFPRFEGQNPEALEKLQTNEAEEIESQFKSAGLTSVKIPKTLYDLFYWRFYMEDMVHSDIKPEDTEKIQKVAQEKFDQGIAKSPAPSYKKLERVYAYTKQGKGDIAIHVPKIDFNLSNKEGPYGKIISNRYRKQEADENYQRVVFRLNERILNYIKDQKIDPNDLSWENMIQVTKSLLNEIDSSYQTDIFHKDKALGDPVEFARKYHLQKDRIQGFLLGAVWHEYQAPPNVYTVYRGAEIEKDFTESDNPFSFSFGHSPLGGLQFDGHSGSPISYSQKTLYALDIDIADYEKGGDAAQVFYIPPARGPNRITEDGEVGHIRTKARPYRDQPISGFTPGGRLGVKQNDLEFLVTPADTPEEAKEHIKVTRVFFKNVHTVIVK